MNRAKTLWAVVIALLITTAGATLSISLTSAQPAPGEVAVRVVARLLHTGEIEFAVQQRASGVWSNTILPRKNRFPAEPSTDRWYVSTSVTLGETITSDSLTPEEAAKPLYLRIAARRLANGKTEFALQSADRGTGQVAEWSERVLPRLRFFPATAVAGRWLMSSPIMAESLVASANTALSGTLPDGDDAGDTASDAANRENCERLASAYSIWWHSDKAQLARDFPGIVATSRQYTADVAAGRCADIAIKAGCAELRSAYATEAAVEAAGISRHAFAESAPEIARLAQLYWLVHQYSRCLG